MVVILIILHYIKGDKSCCHKLGISDRGVLEFSSESGSGQNRAIFPSLEKIQFQINLSPILDFCHIYKIT